MKKTIIFLLMILLVLAFFSSFFWFYEAKYFIGRASENSFSKDNSYLFVTPLQAKANNQEKIRMTVFVLNNKGLGVMGKKVFASRDPNLAVETIQGLTDGYGKAIFDVTSTKPGEYYLEVTVEGTPLKDKGHLIFN